MPPHHAYSDPDLITAVMRSVLPGVVVGGDPDKAMNMVYELANQNNLPLRLPVGAYAVEVVRSKIQSLAVEVDHFAEYSHDLLTE